MEKATKDVIIEAAKLYMSKNNMQGADFARWAKINKSYWSNASNGNYTYKSSRDKTVIIGDRFFNTIASAIDLDMGDIYWDHQDTPQYVISYTTMASVKKYGKIRTIIGATGAGKTYSKGRFMLENPENTYAITVSAIHKIADIIHDICEALDLKIEKGDCRNLRNIREALKTMHLKGLKPMLIVDEVENMKIPAIGLFKMIYDAIIEYTGVVFIGTPQFVEKLLKLEARGKDGVPQFVRRIEAGITHLPDIDRRFDEFMADIEDDGLREILRGRCRNYGVLHDYLEPARREAAAEGVPLTAEFMQLISNLTYKPV